MALREQARYLHLLSQLMPGEVVKLSHLHMAPSRHLHMAVATGCFSIPPLHMGAATAAFLGSLLLLPSSCLCPFRGAEPQAGSCPR